MVFNTYTFLIFFLPLTLAGFLFLCNRERLRGAFGWLVAMSLVYYGWWDWHYLFLVLPLCTANYFLGKYLARHQGTPQGKTVLTCGVTGNLAILCYFKYTGFLGQIIEELTSRQMGWAAVVLPLGISFFTFQKIAYLVDSYRGKTKEYKFLDFLLFVFFFPQLIAGPIVHHNEVMPQFQSGSWNRKRWLNLSVGLTILVIGLFKKVVIADNISPVANKLFDLAATGHRPLTTGEAWCAALAYAAQIYFDFSGYTDMAIGAARLFGVRLPLNFHSPYKATSIIDFWRRWHITLSRFLQQYLYIPLGGNRKGKARRYVNLMITMVLGGIWHGAGWSFLLWGLLHGLYLCVNHAWNFMKERTGFKGLPRPVGVAITFMAVVIAWIFFRAGNYESAAGGSAAQALRASKGILASMFGLNGHQPWWPDKSGFKVKDVHAYRAVECLLICWLLPNTQQLLRRYRPALDITRFAPRERAKWWEWQPTLPWFIFTLLLLLGTLYQFDKVSDFIYFQF